MLRHAPARRVHALTRGNRYGVEFGSRSGRCQYRSGVELGPVSGRPRADLRTIGGPCGADLGSTQCSDHRAPQPAARARIQVGEAGRLFLCGGELMMEGERLVRASPASPCTSTASTRPPTVTSPRPPPRPRARAIERWDARARTHSRAPRSPCRSTLPLVSSGGQAPANLPGNFGELQSKSG